MPRDASPEDSRVTTGIRRRRWLLPAVLVLIWLAVGGPLGSFQGQLAGVAENDNAAFLPTIAESTKVNELQPRFADAAIIPAIIVYERESGITSDDIAAAEDDVAQIGDLDGLVGEISPPLPSEDGQALQIIVPLDANLGDQLSLIVTEIREIVADNDVDFVSVAGPGGIFADSVKPSATSTVSWSSSPHSSWLSSSCSSIGARSCPSSSWSGRPWPWVSRQQPSTAWSRQTSSR